MNHPTTATQHLHSAAMDSLQETFAEVQPESSEARKLELAKRLIEKWLSV